MEVGVGLSTEANITVASIGFNLVIKLDTYIEFIEKACILLRI